MSFFHRKPVTGADGADLMRAAASGKWSLVQRILKGSRMDDDRQAVDNTLLMAVKAGKHSTVKALLKTGADPGAMQGRIMVEAAVNADEKSLRLLFSHQPAIVKYARKARDAVYGQWADIPGGNGMPYRAVTDFLDRIIRNETAITARARRRHQKASLPAPRNV